MLRNLAEFVFRNSAFSPESLNNYFFPFITLKQQNNVVNCTDDLGEKKLCVLCKGNRLAR